MEWGTEVTEVCPPIFQTAKNMSVLVHFVTAENQEVNLQELPNYNVNYVALAITNKTTGDNVVVMNYFDLVGKDRITFQEIADKCKRKMFIDFNDVFSDEAHRKLQRWQKEILDNEP